MILFLVSVRLSTVAYSETEERQLSYSLNRGGLLIEIEAPIQAWPGEKLNITMRAEASTEIHIDFIYADISCLKENLTEILLNSIRFLENFDISQKETYEEHYEVVIPNDALPGLIYGTLRYKWYIEGDIPTHVEDVQTFQVTFVQNKAYEELRQDYEALNSSYTSLESNYTSLWANYSDLLEKYQQLESNQIGENNATGLMYLFIITTGIFVVTTILLLIRRPKTTTW